jgi:hypothetical protein
MTLKKKSNFHVADEQSGIPTKAADDSRGLQYDKAIEMEQ